MWLISKAGFFSTVADRDNPGNLLVRARNLEDIQNITTILGFSDSAFWSDEYTDYAYRLRCTNEEWAGACADIARSIDYDNYKKTVEDTRYPIYYTVWETLRALDDRDFVDISHLY